MFVVGRIYRNIKLISIVRRKDEWNVSCRQEREEELEERDLRTHDRRFRTRQDPGVSPFAVPLACQRSRNLSLPFIRPLAGAYLNLNPECEWKNTESHWKARKGKLKGKAKLLMVCFSRFIILNTTTYLLLITTIFHDAYKDKICL